jgi:hypothetical protein
MRLNGWQRIGIISSVVWIFGAAYHQRTSDLDRAISAADLGVLSCTQTLAPDPKKNCYSDYDRTRDLYMEDSWPKVSTIRPENMPGVTTLLGLKGLNFGICAPCLFWERYHNCLI